MTQQFIFILVLFASLFSTACASLPLEEKLQKQWTQYDQAQKLVLTRLDRSTPAEQIVSREEWEKTLKLQGEYAITASDLKKLREDQKTRITEARLRAIDDSLIDFQAIRSLPPEESVKKITRICSEIPKGGMLHVHPWGTFDRTTIQELLTQKDPELHVDQTLASIEASKGNSILFDNEKLWLVKIDKNAKYSSLSTEAQNAYREFSFLPRGPQPFNRFNAVFAFLGVSIQKQEDYDKALFDFARRAVREGVIYVEFTGGYSPELFKTLQKIEKETGLVIRVNKSFNRTKSAEELGLAAQELLKQPTNPWVVGIDFLDNEEGNPALEKGQLLYGTVLKQVRAGKSKLHRTMHSGEIGDNRNPRDAIILGAERLGHAVLLEEDPVALEYAALKKIPVEINLTSNLRLTKIQKLEDHPYLNYLRLGLPISLSTDDEGLFDTDILHECELALAETDITYAEFKKMAFNSIETSFASEKDKERLKSRLNQSFIKFESTHLN